MKSLLLISWAVSLMSCATMSDGDSASERDNEPRQYYPDKAGWLYPTP